MRAKPLPILVLLLCLFSFSTVAWISGRAQGGLGANGGGKKKEKGISAGCGPKVCTKFERGPEWAAWEGQIVKSGRSGDWRLRLKMAICVCQPVTDCEEYGTEK
jgi:hypothetical protein